MDITTEQLDALADKLDGLDLTDAEQAILDHVIERAAASAAADVAGYVTIGNNFEEIKVSVVGTPPRNPRAQKFFDVFTELSVDGGDS
jgi:hypothetical protein